MQESLYWGASFPFSPIPKEVPLFKKLANSFCIAADEFQHDDQTLVFSLLVSYFLENGDCSFLVPVRMPREQSVNPFGSSSVASERRTAVQCFSIFSPIVLLICFSSYTHTRSLSSPLPILLSLSLPRSRSLLPSHSCSSWRLRLSHVI